jgi:multidrug efflux pump subunit AcrB
VVDSDFGDTVAMLVAIRGKRYGYRELRDFADKIHDEIRTVREAGKLVTYGTQSEEIWITSSLERMAQYFADPSQIANALRQRNVIQSGGNFDADQSKVPVRTTGIFNTENEIRNVLVDVSKDGHPAYIKNFAKVERRYQDPTFIVRYDGDPCLLLSVEMQKGKNIVELGEQLDKVFQRLKVLLPPDVQLDLVANQPGVVKERIATLSHEFLLAIISVVIVTILLLPLRVALIAALAIPVTLCGTLAVMNAVGIALHQVSIAALIMVLGIVVDDAIVIADNYVELLDHKVPKTEAAWRCASDVFVPVLTATITIIASFLPLLIITGSSGEFIMALPIAVAIALAVSFIVAVMLTPLLCRTFIKKGLHDHDAVETHGKEKKKSLLDRLQDTYGVWINRFMNRKWLAFSLGGCAFAFGVMLFTLVPQQFFPSAERDQFVIDVWMPQGTRIEATDAVMGRIEKTLGASKGVAHYATFVGQSSPRFYYNVNPQQPDGAYGQFIVNTDSVKDTTRLVKELRPLLAKVAPEAMVLVKEVQQGAQTEAPIEVRISGDDIGELKRLGEQVQGILEGVSISDYVFRDYFNDSYRVDVKVNDELANRLGITEASVSQTLSKAFDGNEVSTFWEGDRPVSIKLRLDQASRSNFADIGNTYLNSELTSARVPLRAIAQLAPEWQTSRIVRRNGVRTLTIRAFAKPGYYASKILEEAMPKIKALQLPAGYRIDYGGEKFNQDETFPQMLVALGISLVAIFLVLLVQFRNISDPLVVMASIPLTLFGAIFGLIITHNPFGFTAFMGLISLCGIVVRNGIILVDYCNERVAEGETLEQAARDAGTRRLRPIFLTTMAAAVGVTPMILSGSSLWSPLASVIAFVLIFSMFFTLLVVPVIFVVVKSRSMRGLKPAAVAAVAIAACALVAPGKEASAEPVKHSLTLPQAVELALKQNSVLKIGRAKVAESDQKIVSTRAQYFPLLSNNTKLMTFSERQEVTLSAGSLGNVSGSPFPDKDVKLKQGDSTILYSETTLAQPTTQLLKIREANRMARADRGIAEAELKSSENETVLSVHQLYYALLVANKERDAARASLSAAQEYLREFEEGVRAGNVLDVALISAKADLLQSRQALLVAENRISDVTSDLNDLLGLPSDGLLEVTGAELPELTELPKDEAYGQARAGNGELLAARETLEKSRHAVRAAQYEYIPDVTLFAKYGYQDGAPFLKDNIGIFGAELTWNIFDWGKRKGEVGQRVAQQSQAEENLARVDKRIEIEIDKAYRKLERSKQMVDVAREALSLCRENVRLSENRLRAGTVTAAKHAETVAALKKAEMDELQASLQYRLVHAELDRISGALAANR